MKNMSFTTMSRSKGYGIIEIMIGIAIAFGVLGGLLMIGSVLFGKTDASTAQNNFRTMQSGIKQMYSTSNSYAGISNARVLTDNNLLPNSMRGAGNNIKHKYSMNGTGVVLAAASGGALAQATYSNIPGEDCTTFVGPLAAEILFVSVNGTVVNDANGVADNCNPASAANTVIFRWN